jgi:MYXO-CTERM domain-containing protein
MFKLALVGLSAAALASSASAQITPPNFNLSGGNSTAAHQQVLGGGFNVTGFRLTANALQADIDSWQSDIEMTLISPDNTTLLIGPNFATPPGNLAWTNVVLGGTGTLPANSAAAQLIDATFNFNFGQVDGTWSVAFRHTYGQGTSIAWENITVTPIPAPGALALLGMGGLVAARRRR